MCVCFYLPFLLPLAQEVIRQDGDERKPGENVDSSQWKDTIVYERNEGEYFPGTRVSHTALTGSFGDSERCTLEPISSVFYREFLTEGRSLHNYKMGAV